MEISSESWDRLIRDGIKEFGIQLDSSGIKKISLHAGELIQWNRKINLTAIHDPFEMAVKHFIDSIAAAKYIKPDDSIIDIGSGGGFPGIPLAVIYPSLSVTLIDASRKKVSFLKHTIRTLKLKNISVYQTRAEEAGKDDRFKGSFDVVISRAVFTLKKLLSIALPLVSEKGIIIAMKGKKNNEHKELPEAMEQLRDWQNENLKRSFRYSVERYRLRQINAERSLFLFDVSSLVHNVSHHQ